MKIIKIDWCFKVVLPDITMRNTSGHVIDGVHCPYLFQHITKYYCTLINQKFRVYRSYGDMKKMFVDCPLEDISNVDKLVAQLEAQLEEMREQLKQIENLSDNDVQLTRSEDQLKMLLKQVKEHC